MASSPDDTSSTLDDQTHISEIEIEPHYTQYDRLDDSEDMMDADQPTNSPADLEIEYVQCDNVDVTLGNSVNAKTSDVSSTATQPSQHLQQPLQSSPPRNDDNLGAEFRSNFFTHIESNAPAAELPVYLKYLLTLNGFDNVIAFSMLDEAAIVELEQFGRTELLDLLRQLVPTLREDQLPLFFHLYWRNPGDFKIMQGHRQMLLQMAKYCNKLWSNNWRPAAKQELRDARTATQERPVVFAANEHIDEPNPTASTSLTNADHDENVYEQKSLVWTDEELKKKDSSINLLKSVNRSLRAQFAAGTIGRVQVTRVNAADHTVQCSVCMSNIKVSFNRGRLVVSNVLRHVKQHFKNLAADTSVTRPIEKKRLSHSVGTNSVATDIKSSSIVTNSDSDLLAFANRIIEKNLCDYPAHIDMLASTASATASTIQCAVCLKNIQIGKILGMDGVARWFAPNFVRHMRGHLDDATKSTVSEDESSAHSESEAESAQNRSSNIVTKSDADLLAFVNGTLVPHFGEASAAVALSACAVESTVQCSVCERDVKIQSRQSGSKNRRRWFASNFGKHMRTHFPDGNATGSPKPTVKYEAVERNVDPDHPPVGDIRSDAGMANYLNRWLRKHYTADIACKLLINKTHAATASVQCRVCKRNIKISIQKRGKSFRWLVSNLLRHYNIHFPRSKYIKLE